MCSTCRTFHRRQRLVLAQFLVRYFCLPGSGENMRPHPEHSCAMLLLKQGVDPKFVQELQEPTDISLTLNV